MKAPEPAFTSNTRASAPSANFLERMEAVMRGIDSTVAVTSRRAYSLRSAGTIDSLWPIMAKPTRRSASRKRGRSRSVR